MSMHSNLSLAKRANRDWQQIYTLLAKLSALCWPSSIWGKFTSWTSCYWASQRPQPLVTTPHLIAGWPKGMCSIAVAWLTAGPTGQLPGIGCTLITVLPDHIGKTQALTSGFVTVAVRAITVLLHSAQVIADTLWNRTAWSNAHLVTFTGTQQAEASYMQTARLFSLQISKLTRKKKKPKSSFKTNA